ncbi:MAG TPA: 8-amino-7-oxononanoate synthase [Clostridia bacterium]|nr:8-amino-7-oxononanoate synthase [Clostridia bacterium]
MVMRFLADELNKLQRQNLLRETRCFNGSQSPHTVIEGKRCLLLSSNNYLGLTEHPEVKEAAKREIDRWGSGAGGARLTTGGYALQKTFEDEIASFKKTSAALLFSSGYAANLGIIQALTGNEDVIISDRLNHASIIDGARLSKARVKVYNHGDTAHLEKILKEALGYRRRLIVTDGVFSMDGDLAPLPQIVDLAKRYNAILMVDDAHGTGVFGCDGTGSVGHFGLEGKIQIQMGTLSKALGSAGAYVAGSEELVNYLKNKARSFIFSTAPTPGAVGAARVALKIVQNNPQIRRKLWRNIRYLRCGLVGLGYRIPAHESPIIPIFIGDAGKTMYLAKELQNGGVFAPGIRPPTVPRGMSRIRVTVMATHTIADLDCALLAFKLAGKRIGIIR